MAQLSRQYLDVVDVHRGCVPCWPFLGRVGHCRHGDERAQVAWAFQVARLPAVSALLLFGNRGTESFVKDVVWRHIWMSELHAVGSR